MVFFVTSGILTFGGLVFVLFAEGEQLSWAQQDEASEEETETDDTRNRRPSCDD